MGDGENVRPERGGFTVREVAQSAVEPTLLGEFIEVVVRVPIQRESTTQDAWCVPGDWSHADIAEALRQEYLSACGFIADASDVPGTRTVVRLRARQGQDMLRDEFVEIWGGSDGVALGEGQG